MGQAIRMRNPNLADSSYLHPVIPALDSVISQLFAPGSLICVQSISTLTVAVARVSDMKALTYAMAGICFSLLAIQICLIIGIISPQSGFASELGIGGFFIMAIGAMLSAVITALTAERGSPLRLFALIVIASEFVFLVLG